MCDISDNNINHTLSAFTARTARNNNKLLLLLIYNLNLACIINVILFYYYLYKLLWWACMSICKLVLDNGTIQMCYLLLFVIASKIVAHLFVILFYNSGDVLSRSPGGQMA